MAAPHLDTTVKIADILQVSLDELVGRTEPTQKPLIRNHQLHALCQQMDQLSDEDPKALIILMDSLVKRSQVAKLLAS